MDNVGEQILQTLQVVYDPFSSNADRASAQRVLKCNIERLSPNNR